MKKCPKCGNDTFFVTAHVTQGWLVDGNENWIKTTAECEQVEHLPDDEDVWQCEKCGYDAAGEKFNTGVAR